jgi:mRNA interferase HigB
MIVVSTKILREFWEEHPDVETALKIWYKTVEKADWTDSHDIKNDFGSADPIGDNRVIFNIKGNQYRIIAIVIYRNHRVYIRWIGTHKQYDKIDPYKV